MEAILFIIGLVLLIVTAKINSRLKELINLNTPKQPNDVHNQLLLNKIANLERQIAKLTATIENKDLKSTTNYAPTPKQPQQITPKIAIEPLIAPPPLPQTPPKPAQKVTPPLKKTPPLTQEQKRLKELYGKQKTTKKSPIVQKTPPNTKVTTNKNHQTTKNTTDAEGFKAPTKIATDFTTLIGSDWEKFIGENLINKIGITILLIGVAFFVQYSIGKGWIGPLGRMGIGIGIGGALLGLGHYLRNRFRAFSSVLVGGGLAVEYITIAMSFQFYGNEIGLSQSLAFVMMIVITGFAVALSLLYNKRALAIIALLGGLVTPLVLDTGTNPQYAFLFSYIALLNIGILVLSYYKNWYSLNIIAYISTILFYGGWLMGVIDFTAKNPPFFIALFFGTLFYLIFFLMNIINNIREKRRFNALEISLLMSNTALFYGAIMYVLSYLENGAYQGLFTALMAVFNFGFAYILFRNTKVDRNLVYLLIGLVLTFLSLVAPVQLEGDHITLFWAAESVLLMWLSQQSKIQFIKISSFIVIILMLFSLVMNWLYAYTIEDSVPSLASPVFLTGFIVAAALVVHQYLFNKEPDGEDFYKITYHDLKILFIGLAILVLYLVGFLELHYHLSHSKIPDAAQYIYLGVYNFAYLMGLLLFDWQFNRHRFQPVALSLIALLSYIIFYNTQVIDVRTLKYFTAFNWHYVLLLLLIGIVVMVYKNTTALQVKNSHIQRSVLWLLSFSIVYIASAELDHTLVLTNPTVPPSTILQQNVRSGYPILWGVLSFIFMIVGMQLKNKDLRIISLVLFFVILLKLFLIDVWAMNRLGRIVAFISLGILLLIMSFLYQRLKVLILDEET